MDGGGSNRVEFTLGFKTDTSGAEQNLNRFREQIRGVDRAAEDAKKSLDRMSHADRAAAGGGNVFGGQTYGVGPPPLPGTSAGQAYANSMRGGPPLPTWQVGAAPYGTPAAGPGGYRPPGMRSPAEAEGGLAKLLEVGLIVEAVHRVVESLNTFAESLDKAAVTKDAAGRPSANPGWMAALNTFSQLPLTQTGAGVADWALRDSPFGADFRRLTGTPEGTREAAAVGRYDASLAVAQQPTRFEHERAYDERIRQHTELGRAARSADAAAATIDFRMPGLIQRYEISPDVARAQAASVLPQERYKDALNRHAHARLEVDNRTDFLGRAERDLRAAQGNVNPDNSLFSSMVPTARDRNATEFLRVEEARNRVLEETKRLKEALNQQERTGLDVARSKLEADKASNAAKRAEVEYDYGLAKGTAEQFGTSDFWTNRSAVEAVRKWKSKGIDQLSPEERQQVMGIPAAADQFRQELGRFTDQNDPNIRELRDLLGLGSLGSLEEKRRPLIKAELTAEVNEAQIAAQGKKLADEVLPKVLKAMQDGFDGQLQLIEGKMQAAKAIQGS